MTVYKLLTGKDAPLSAIEYAYWMEYSRIKAEQQEQSNQQRQSPHQGPRTLGSGES